MPPPSRAATIRNPGFWVTMSGLVNRMSAGKISAEMIIPRIVLLSPTCLGFLFLCVIAFPYFLKLSFVGLGVGVLSCGLCVVAGQYV